MGIKYFDLWIWDHKLKKYKSQRYTGWKDVDGLNISNNVDRCEIFIGKGNNVTKSKRGNRTFRLCV